MNRFAVAVIAFLVTTSALAADTQRYLVATKRPFRAGALEAVRRAAVDIEPRDVTGFETFNGFAADLTAEEVETLRLSGEVRWVEPVVARYAFDVDRNLVGQTIPSGIDAISARQAAAGVRQGVVNVAVIDTGIDYDHPELKAIYAGGFNAFDEKVSAKDDNGHGTHVAGTIAAADNTLGVIGVATSNVRLWAVKALDAGGAGTNEGIIKAIDWVTKQKQTLGGNWVVNLSLGSTEDSPGEREAFTRATDAGLLVVAATGNGSSPNMPAAVAYPAAYSSVIAVGAVDTDRRLAYFSNQGAEVDFTAPGVQVLSTVPVGTSQLAFVHDGANAHRAAGLTGSKLGTVRAEYVYCGVGKPEEFPANVQGKIALIKRGGEITFANKTRAAMKAGAVAVVIFNHDQSTNPWTLISDADADKENWPIVLRLSLSSGEALVAKGTGTLTIAHDRDDYGEKTGTSMSTPHVAGAAALLWTLAPNATAQQIENALIATALDMGPAGKDPQFGHGVINAYTAGRLLAPNAYPSSPTTGRGIGRR